MTRFRGGLLCVIVLIGVSWARPQNPNATVSGLVLDSSGAVVPGVSVQAINDATNVVRQTMTNSQGIYSIPDLLPGSYHIQLRKDGFKTFVKPGIRDCSEMLILSGQILAMKRQIPAARHALEKACRLEPQNPEAHYQLGVLFDSRQLHPDAVEQFDEVLALRPHDPRAFDYLALNLESLGEARKAEAAYLKGLKVNDGALFDSFLKYNYGRFLMKANRLAESKVQLDRAVKLAPETRAVYYERGRLNLRLLKYKEAQADAERALSLPDPSHSILDLQVYYLLSSVYTRLGDTEQARKYTALCRTSLVPIESLGRGDR